jgi:hypothetical protein
MAVEPSDPTAPERAFIFDGGARIASQSIRVGPISQRARTWSWGRGVRPSSEDDTNPRNLFASPADDLVENTKGTNMRLASSTLSIALLVTGLGLETGCAVTSWLSSSHAPEIKPKEPIALENRLAEDGEKPNGEVDHFAVLIGANTELRHRGNLSLAYQVLLEQGYKAENIFILDAEGETPFFPVTDVTTRDAMHRLFAHLKRVVEPQDTLFIYVTGHGRRVTADKEDNGQKGTIGVSTILLNKTEEMSDWEFSTLLDGLNPETGIAFFDQCYGARFSMIAKSCNFVFITTADETETSYGVTFPRAFWSAFREPDLSKGPLSVLDAFKFAMVADRGTRLGFNRPKISNNCVNPANLTLLGTPRPSPTVLSSAAER